MPKSVTPIEGILAELVDDFAPLRIAVDHFRTTSNLHDRLWEKIKVHLAKHPGDKTVTLCGNKYVIEVDACQPKRVVKPLAAVYERLKKLFGAKRFWELVTFPVTPIDAMFSDDEQKKNFIDTSQTGARKIISVELIDGVAKAA
jgi:hypothetical protein